MLPAIPKNMAHWSSGLRHRPLTAVTGVRIPYGSPKQTPSIDKHDLSADGVCLHEAIGFKLLEMASILIGFIHNYRALYAVISRYFGIYHKINLLTGGLQ